MEDDGHCNCRMSEGECSLGPTITHKGQLIRTQRPSMVTKAVFLDQTHLTSPLPNFPLATPKTYKTSLC